MTRHYLLILMLFESISGLGQSPIITSLSIDYGMTNSRLSIKGKGFGNSEQEIQVVFGNQVAEIIFLTDTRVDALVPDSPPGMLHISIIKDSQTSNSKPFSILKPTYPYYYSKGIKVGKPFMKIVPTDIDKDNQKDLIIYRGDSNFLRWIEFQGEEINLSYPIAFDWENEITIEKIKAIDFDFDNDMDLLGTTQNNRFIKILRNDGFQNFETQTLIDLDTLESTRHVDEFHLVDFDFDGDLDIVCTLLDEPETSRYFSSVFWFENINDEFLTHYVEIDDKTKAIWEIENITVDDIDGDGDLDLIAPIQVYPGQDFYLGDTKFYYYINDGNFSFSKRVLSWASQRNTIFLFDIDSDGDLDILTDEYYFTEGGCGVCNDLTDSWVRWYENIGNADFKRKDIILHYEFDVPGGSIIRGIADLKGDGDYDILSSVDLDWAVNRDNGTFEVSKFNYRSNDSGISRNYYTNTNLASGQLIDIDNDGRLDIVYNSPNSGILIYFNNELNFQSDFTSFMAGETVGTISAEEKRIELLIPWASSFQLTTIFELSSGASAYLSGDLQSSGINLVDFTDTVKYVIVAENEYDSSIWDVIIRYKNSPPEINDTSYNINENSPASTSVGVVLAVDPDDDILSFTITSGNDLGAFQIDANTAEITVSDSESLDFEANPTFSLQVQVSDGELTDVGIITINLNDVEEEILVTVDDQGNNVRLYPNPARDFTNIEWDNFKRATIFDLSGKELFKSYCRTLDLRTLNPGAYLVTLGGTNNERITFRIIKE